MSRFGPPRISDPDSWEGRMARDHAYPFTLAKWQHQRWIEAGIISQPSEAWGTPTWFTDDMPGGYNNSEEVDWDQLHGIFDNGGFEVVDFTDDIDSDGSPWVRSDPPPDHANPPPYAGAVYSVNGVDITEFVQAISFNAESFGEALRQVGQQISAALGEAENFIQVSFHQISDSIEDDPFYIDWDEHPICAEDDLSSRPLTEEDFQRWEDAINYEPTQRYFKSSEPQSDETGDLLDRIAAGVREWDDEKDDKDRGDT